MKTPYSILLSLFILLTVSSVRSDILSVHCPVGCPTNPKTNDLVFAHLYALSNNPSTKFADWVAYEVDILNFGTSPGRNWASDPLLDENETLEKDDYKNASQTLKVDRGHQAPLASFAGSRYWHELNYLSNITPQKSALNQGAWVKLESAIRAAVGFRDSLFVITGAIYENASEQLPKADETHEIPTSYYKIVYDSKGRAASFLMSQQLPRGTDFCSTKRPISDIENRLSYKLPTLSNDAKILKRLGC